MWLKTSLIKFRFLDEREKVDCLKYGVGKVLGKQSRKQCRRQHADGTAAWQWHIPTCKRETRLGKGPLPLGRPACSELSELCVPLSLRMVGNVIFKG